MKIILISSLIFIFSIVNSFSQPPIPVEVKKSGADSGERISNIEAEKVSNKFINYFIKNEADSMYAMFNDEVKAQLTLEQTAGIWEQVTAAYGEFENRGNIETSDYNDMVLSRCLLSFSNGGFEARLTIDKNKKVSGFFLVPHNEETQYVIPSYVDTTKFVETGVKFGSQGFALDGVISLPRSEKPTPVVILVHGSGPHDMDESIGPNKPFKDIAWGLASNGIAVLRYNKRTKQYPAQLMNMIDSVDVYDETIYDAIIAINMLYHNPDLYHIDKDQIYVLGHSLGGTLLPRIAKDNEHIKGMISMAGMSRKMKDVLLEQYDYLFSLDGEISQDEKDKIEELKRQINNMDPKNLTLQTPADSLPMNLPAKYWMTFNKIDPANEMKDFKNKVLILQGLRDYQVTFEDFEIWQKALESKKNVEFKLYNELNHLMQKGVGRSKPDEYYLQNSVDKEVIQDISNWITK